MIWPETVKDWAELIAYAVAVVAAACSAFLYFGNSKRERMRWLAELYDRFYGNPEFRQMRVRIDLGKTRFARDEKDSKAMGELDDFLNFFELVAYLRERNQLKDEEIAAMFDYPLRLLARDEYVSAYVAKKEYGYEKLRELLKRFR